MRRRIYELSKSSMIASGGEKMVFNHPDSDDFLIKVWKPQHFEWLKKRYPLLTRFRRFPRYISLLNEVTEYVALSEYCDNDSYLQGFHGFVRTDLGPGVVVEAVRDNEGNLAKSLYQLIGAGEYGDRQRQAVNELVEWLEGNYIIIRDFTLHNVVWNAISGHFVIIDGIGSRPILSMRQLSTRYNRYTMQKKIAKFLRRLDVALSACSAESLSVN